MKYTPDELARIAKTIRKDIILMTAEAKGGHYMSSLSCVDILVALYFSALRHNPAEPEAPDRDRMVLSKGHAAPALYAVLAECGYFPKEELLSLRRYDSRLQGHPVYHRLPGLDASSGSLGQGISTAVGIALAGKLDRKDYRVFVLLGDGECQEGQVWEAAMSAAHYRLDNLVVLIDKNDLQISGSTDGVMSLGDLGNKWRSFGWEVFEVNGHTIPDLIETLGRARAVLHRPVVIIASTVKGSGVPFIENNLNYHTAPLTDDELKRALGYFG